MKRDSFSFLACGMSKTFMILLLASLFVALPSCKKDKYWEPDDVQEKLEEEFLNIAIASTGGAFRAGEEDPIAKLQDLTFLFFDGDTPESKIVYIKELSASEATAERQYTIRLKKGDYHLLVMANKTSYFLQRARVGTTLGAFNKRTEIKEKSRFMDTNNLLVTMFNAQGLVPIKESQFTPSEAEEHAASIKVELEPTVSRFIISEYPTMSEEIKNLIPDKYYFSIANSETTQSPLRELAPRADGVLETLGDASSPQDRYTFSPSYKPLEACKSEEEHRKVYREYRFYDAPTIPSYENWYDKSETLEEKRKKARSYRFETTNSSKVLLTAIVPHIFVIYRLCPVSLSPAENEGWISYKGHYLLESDFKTLLQEVANPEANPRTPEGFPSDFLEAVKQVSKDTGLARLQKGFEAHGIRFYYKSLNYYAWPVRHFSDAHAPDADSYGRYGVVRNNEYCIKVKRLSTFGLPHPSFISEDFSPLKQVSSSQIEITVLPMLVRDEQEVEY